MLTLCTPSCMANSSLLLTHFQDENIQARLVTALFPDLNLFSRFGTTRTAPQHHYTLSKVSAGIANWMRIIISIIYVSETGPSINISPHFYSHNIWHTLSDNFAGHIFTVNFPPSSPMLCMGAERNFPGGTATGLPRFLGLYKCLDHCSARL